MLDSARERALLYMCVCLCCPSAHMDDGRNQNATIALAASYCRINGLAFRLLKKRICCRRFAVVVAVCQIFHNLQNRFQFFFSSFV